MYMYMYMYSRYLMADADVGYHVMKSTYFAANTMLMSTLRLHRFL